MPRKGQKCKPGCRCGLHQRHSRPNERGPRHNAESRAKIGKASRERERTDKDRKAISEGHIKRFKKIEKDHPYHLPATKKCTLCGRRRKRKFFNIKYTELASGITRAYLTPECKDCSAQRAKDWRKRKRKEGKLDKIQKRQRKKAESKGSRKHYKREYQVSKRKEKGSQSREARSEPEGTTPMPIGPFIGFLKEIMKGRGLNHTDIAVRSGLDPSKVDRIIKGVNANGAPLKNVSISTVDKILVGLDREEMLTILYPQK